MNVKSRVERAEQLACGIPRTLDEIRYLAATLPPERAIVELSSDELTRWLYDDLVRGTPEQAADELRWLASDLGASAIPREWLARWCPELLEANHEPGA